MLNRNKKKEKLVLKVKWGETVKYVFNFTRNLIYTIFNTFKTF